MGPKEMLARAGGITAVIVGIGCTGTGMILMETASTEALRVDDTLKQRPESPFSSSEASAPVSEVPADVQIQYYRDLSIFTGKIAQQEINTANMRANGFASLTFGIAGLAMGIGLMNKASSLSKEKLAAKTPEETPPQ